MNAKERFYADQAKKTPQPKSLLGKVNVKLAQKQAPQPNLSQSLANKQFSQLSSPYQIKYKELSKLVPGVDVSKRAAGTSKREALFGTVQQAKAEQSRQLALQQRARQQKEMQTMLTPPDKNVVFKGGQGFSVAPEKQQAFLQPQQQQTTQPKVEPSLWEKTKSFVKDIPSLAKYAVQHPKEVVNQIPQTLSDIGTEATFGAGKLLGDASQAVQYQLGGKQEIDKINNQKLAIQDDIASKLKNPKLSSKAKEHLLKLNDTITKPTAAADIYDFAKKTNLQIGGEALGALADALTFGIGSAGLKTALNQGGIKPLLKYLTTKEGMGFLAKQSLAGGTQFAVGGVGSDIEQQKSKEEILQNIPKNYLTGALAQPIMEVAGGAIGSKIARKAPKSEIETAAVKVGDKTYTGASHNEAIAKAPKELQADLLKNKDTKDFGFIDKEGNFITRKEAEKTYGVSASEEVPKLKEQQVGEKQPEKIAAKIEEKPKVKTFEKPAPVKEEGALVKARKAQIEKTKVIEKPVEVKPKEQELKYESTIKTSGLAKSVKSQAIKDKIIYGFDKDFRDLPDYDKRIKKDDLAKATDFVLNDTEKARNVAMGLERAPEGMLPEDVYVATYQHAVATKDVEMIRKLANESSLVGEATQMGQRIQALSQLNPDSSLSRMTDVKKAREAKVGEKINQQKTSLKESAKTEMSKVHLPKEELQWDKFLSTISC